ncbi:MAG: hypothetical protein PHC37_06235 [Candidatus Omnitrophica bacterium]|nr:hypothetical protein [Candidatus Omnitrophota bacterium]
MIKNKKGLALIVVIMLIVFVAICVLGISTFIVQWLEQLNADQINAKCLYLAQAGVQSALYNVRNIYISTYNTLGYYATGLFTVDSGETYRLGGNAADFLMVYTSDTRAQGTEFLGLYIQNATNSALPVVSIDRMVVTWTISGGGGGGHWWWGSSATLQSIRIGGWDRWTGNLNSPANADFITNYTLTGTSAISVDRLRFSSSIQNLSSMSIEFVMTDGSSKTVAVYPPSDTCQFTINSTGKVSGSSIYRTIRATYDLTPLNFNTDSKIVDIDEINTEITSP